MVIKKLPGQQEWRLYSHEGRNLGTFLTKEAALRHEREVEYFKHQKQ